MTTTPAAPRRRITNRRMFVIMLGRALARRRSRGAVAIADITASDPDGTAIVSPENDQ